MEGIETLREWTRRRCRCCRGGGVCWCCSCPGGACDSDDAADESEWELPSMEAVDCVVAVAVESKGGGGDDDGDDRDLAPLTDPDVLKFGRSIPSDLLTAAGRRAHSSEGQPLRGVGALEANPERSPPCLLSRPLSLER